MRSVALACLFTTGCSGIAWDRGDYVALSAMAACQALDAATTVYGIEHEGMEEQNPVMPNSGWANIPVKVAAITLFTGVAHAMPGHAERRVVLGIGATAGCVAGGINASRF